MKLVEFTHNKQRILLDADNVLTVRAAVSQDCSDAKTRQEYWQRRAEAADGRHTCIIFKEASARRSQYVDQTFDEVRDTLNAAAGSAPTPSHP